MPIFRIHLRSSQVKVEIVFCLCFLKKSIVAVFVPTGMCRASSCLHCFAKWRLHIIVHLTAGVILQIPQTTFQEQENKSKNGHRGKHRGGVSRSILRVASRMQFDCGELCIVYCENGHSNYKTHTGALTGWKICVGDQFCTFW